MKSRAESPEINFDSRASRRDFFRLAALAGGTLVLLGQGRHPPPVPQPDPTGIYGLFFCTCGCRQNLRDCVPASCGTSKNMRSKIDRYLAQGMNREDILREMANEYGITVLQEPGKKGFNWFWYITPFAIFGIGGAVVYYVLKGMTARPPDSGRDPRPAAPSPDEQRLKNQIEEEIREDL